MKPCRINQGFPKSLVLVFALLIRDAAACLTGRLARSLALAAAAVPGALAKIAGLQSNYPLHIIISYLDCSRFNP